MVEAGLKIVSFRGNNLFNATFETFFVGGEGIAFDTFKATTIETEVINNFPVFGRMQPDGLRFSIEVHLVGGPTQDNIDEMKSYFTPDADQGYLIADAGYGTGNRRRLLCTSEGLVSQPENNIVFKVLMRASTGVWESNTGNTGTPNISSSGGTFNITCEGTYPNKPVFTITPRSVKTAGTDYLKRRRAWFSNPSNMPIDHPVGDGYPIDIASGALDTTALNGASKLQVGLNDLRVLLNSEEIPRWVSPNSLDTNNKVWINMQARPGRVAVLATSINNSVTALTSSNIDGFGGWPNSWVAKIDDEIIIYNNRTPTEMPVIVRGTCGTTAASHTAGTNIYFVEHRYLNLIYANSGVSSPDGMAGKQPVIDLNASYNGKFVWPGPYFNDEDLRSATWSKVYTDDNAGSPYITLTESSGVMYFKNQFAYVGAPRANNAIFDLPFGIQSIIATGISAGVVAVAKNANSWIKTTKVVTNSYFFVQTGPNEQTPITSQVTTSTSIEAAFGQGTDTENTSYIFYQTGGTNNNSVPYQVTTITYSQVSGNANDPTGVLETLIFKKFVVDQDGYESEYVAGTPAIPVFRVRLNTAFPMGLDDNGNPYAALPELALTPDGAEVMVATITISFDPTLLPVLFLGAEESLYLNQIHLENTTNGSYIDLFFPQALNQSLRIDCDAQRVIDLETGFEVTWAASPGADWPYNTPGVTNVWSVTDIGLTSVDVGWSKHDCWL